ncbi:hypothetical protein G7046_g2802 [Stylonectria norvegica]|nr:hypothetical protein G7046_g2802 [Stylonectria norvegica]
MRSLNSLVFAISLAASGALSSPAAVKRTLNIAHQSRGIISVEFDPQKSSQDSLKVLTTTQAGFQPGWLCSRDDTLYSVSRSHYPDSTSESGGLFAFSENHHTGKKQPIDNVSSKGNGGVYCDISKNGKVISVANIDGSTVSLHSRHSNGRIEEAFQVIHYNLTTPGPGTNDSQIQANPHQAAFDPSGEFVFVPDRGSDALYVYRVARSNRLVQIQRFALPPGTGPRHVTFSVVNKSRTLVYLVSELDNTIRVFTMDRIRGTSSFLEAFYSDERIRIEQIQVASTLGPGDSRTAPDNHDLAAEVAVSNDRRFVYVANRNTVSLHSDTISIYKLDEASHKPLTYLGHNATYGKIPRHFSLSNDATNQFVSVANEVSNNLIILSRNTKTGYMEKVVGNLTLGEFDTTLQVGPMAVIWR